MPAPHLHDLHVPKQGDRGRNGHCAGTGLRFRGRLRPRTTKGHARAAHGPLPRSSSRTKDHNGIRPTRTHQEGDRRSSKSERQEDEAAQRPRCMQSRHVAPWRWRSTHHRRLQLPAQPQQFQLISDNATDPPVSTRTHQAGRQGARRPFRRNGTSIA